MRCCPAVEHCPLFQQLQILASLLPVNRRGRQTPVGSACSDRPGAAGQRLDLSGLIEIRHRDVRFFNGFSRLELASFISTV